MYDLWLNFYNYDTVTFQFQYSSSSEKERKRKQRHTASLSKNQVISSSVLPTIFGQKITSEILTFI